MSTGESFESRFEKIDVTLKDPKSEVNVDCLLVKRTSLDKKRIKAEAVDVAATKTNSIASSS